MTARCLDAVPKLTMTQSVSSFPSLGWIWSYLGDYRNSNVIRNLGCRNVAYLRGVSSLARGGGSVLEQPTLPRPGENGARNFLLIKFLQVPIAAMTGVPIRHLEIALTSVSSDIYTTG